VFDNSTAIRYSTWEHCSIRIHIHSDRNSDFGISKSRSANNRESLVVGTPEQIKSITLEKFRATSTDQSAISQLEGDVSAVVDPPAERGLPIIIDCSHDFRTGTWTWTIAIGIEGGDIRVWNSIIVSRIFFSSMQPIYPLFTSSFFYISVNQLCEKNDNTS
jgi:hypothetical protein